jgi:hypothetical protein
MIHYPSIPETPSQCFVDRSRHLYSHNPHVILLSMLCNDISMKYREIIFADRFDRGQEPRLTRC